MKQNKIIILCLSALCFSGCADFLAESSDAMLTGKMVFDTPEKLEAQIYGIVDAFDQSELFTQSMQEYLHSASGIIIWKAQRLADQWLDGLYFTKYSADPKNSTRYAQLYTGVNRCNCLLDGLVSSPVDEDFKQEIGAEAKFYRAVFYYTLVRLYGDVPLIVKSPVASGTLNNPRTAYYKVYEQIIRDLNDAEEMMRDKIRAEQMAPGKGRPCNWAATAFKASVYMTIGSLLSSYEADPSDQFFDETKTSRLPDFSAIGITDADSAWNLAYETSEKVINYGPYSLVPDYRTLFRWTEESDWYLPERIFVIQNTVSVKSGNKLALYSLPQYCEGTSQREIENGNDGRYRPSRFFFQKFAADNGGVKGTAATGEDNDIYVSCPDPRFDATFIHTSYISEKKQKKQTIYPYYNRIYTNDSGTAYPYFKKYRDPRFNVNTGYADFYMMRLAEMYLISAEASASLSEAREDMWWNRALDRIETLHARARASVDKGTAPSPTWKDREFGSTEDLVNAIMWERFYEMSGEGHEYFDTHRRGARWLVEQIARPLNEHLHQVEQGPRGDVPGIWAYTYLNHEFTTSVQDMRKSLLCAFPYVEATYNSAIDPVKDQNDFFWQ